MIRRPRQLFPLFVFDKNKKESWFYLFLLTAFLIGCATIAYTITLPEELGTRSPRQHVRYLEPFVIPFYVLMLNALDRKNFHKVHFTMIVYYEYFARFICKSDILLLAVRVLMALTIGIGFLLLRKDKEIFLRVFSILFIGLNLINYIAGYFACTYRYTIDKEQRMQVSMANDYLWSVPGNILLLTDEGWESEDSRLFDTYVSRDFYVAEIDSIEANGFLEDAVLDLQTESLPCNFPNNKNRKPEKIYFEAGKSF